jgi:hypothetical protein
MKHLSILGTSVAGVLVCGVLLCPVTVNRAQADELPEDYKKVVKRGLDWLAKTQNKDGHWEAQGGAYPITATAMAGMALLMEGSTIREGKYAVNIRRAVDFLMSRSQSNGLIGNPNIPGEAGRYMYGHGFATLFLSCIYGEEEDGETRRKLEDILTRACDFIGKAQTHHQKGHKTGKPLGGWGYVSAADGGNFDEGSVTITQLQAVRAARNAGIAVKKEIIDKALTYLEECTSPQGGIIYSYAQGAGGGGGSPALTAAAVSCGFNAGEYNSPLVKKWIEFCKQHLNVGVAGGRMGYHDEYTLYYWGQSVYGMGETGYARMFPKSEPKDRITWSDFRKKFFESIKTSIRDDHWEGGHVGPAFVTSIYLTILQLDNATLPFYQR